MPITRLQEGMDRIVMRILKLLGIVVAILLMIAFFAGDTTLWRAMIILSGLMIALLSIMLISWLSIQLVAYSIDFRLGFRRTIKPRLTVLPGNKHRLSNAEMRGTVIFLRNNLRNLWNFDTPIDTTKLEEGLTSMTDDASRVSHYELKSIEIMLHRGRRRLRRVRFLLVVGIAFTFFLIGCMTGILFVYWINMK
jgi:hypothetical protein